MIYPGELRSVICETAAPVGRALWLEVGRAATAVGGRVEPCFLPSEPHPSSPAPKPGLAFRRRGAALLATLVIALFLCPPLAADDFQGLGLHERQGPAYAKNGAAIGAELQVNTYVTGWQVAPFVRTDDDGEFVVAWVSQGSSGTDTDLGSIQVFTSRIFAGGFESGDTAGWSVAVP